MNVRNVNPASVPGFYYLLSIWNINIPTSEFQNRLSSKSKPSPLILPQAAQKSNPKWGLGAITKIYSFMKYNLNDKYMLPQDTSSVVPFDFVIL